MCNYYRKYTLSFSDVCKPLYDRISDFGDWKNYEIDAFKALIVAISEALLIIPSNNQKLTLGNNAVSAILETDNRQPVFCSCLLNKT